MSCERSVAMFDNAVPCELPDGHPHRGQPLHTATVYGVAGNASTPVLVKWIDSRDPLPRTQVTP